MAQEQKLKKKGVRVYIPLFIVIGIILAITLYWYGQYTKFVRTDDAYIDTDNVSVSSKMLGRIVGLYAAEGDSIKQGELLAELDSSDLVAQREQNIAMKKQSMANLEQVIAQYNYNKESLKVLEANFDKAKEDFNRSKIQFTGGVISQEQYDHSRQSYVAADAQLGAAKSQLKVSEAQIGSSKAAIESAQAQIAVMESHLKNTKLYSPINGLVAKRWLLSGDIVQPGQSVLTVTNNKRLWVQVYLEETKISDVHLNQDVQFTVDAIQGVTFTGKVFSIGSNTASQFSLIPPSNASGNFTKVTQRIPLKISIDGTVKGSKLSDYNILAGMSVVVKIVKDRE